MRETLYTANVSGDNAVLEINFEQMRTGMTMPPKRVQVSDLRGVSG
jgi:hypothetical protein